jgi:hypothetical protein
MLITMHLSDLKLADNFQAKEFVVDVLIGSDNAWLFLTGQCVRGNGPTAQASTLGTLLFGPLDVEDQICTGHKAISHCVTTLVENFAEPMLLADRRSLTNRELETKLNAMFRCSEVCVNDVISREDDADDIFVSNYRNKISSITYPCHGRRITRNFLQICSSANDD